MLASIAGQNVPRWRRTGVSGHGESWLNEMSREWFPFPVSVFMPVRGATFGELSPSAKTVTSRVSGSGGFRVLGVNLRIYRFFRTDFSGRILQKGDCRSLGSDRLALDMAREMLAAAGPDTGGVEVWERSRVVGCARRAVTAFPGIAAVNAAGVACS